MLIHISLRFDDFFSLNQTGVPGQNFPKNCVGELSSCRCILRNATSLSIENELLLGNR